MTDTTAGEGVVVPRLQMKMALANAIWSLDRNETTNARVEMCKAQDILTLATQPSAGAQGEAVRWIVDARFKAEPGYKSGGGVSAIVDTQQKADAEEARLLAFDRTESVTVTPLYATPAQTHTRDVTALREALTPSGDTKAAYSGEFKFQVTQWRENEDPDSDDEMEEYLADFTVPWTTIKEIMAAISERAALSKPNAPGSNADGGA